MKNENFLANSKIECRHDMEWWKQFLGQLCKVPMIVGSYLTIWEEKLVVSELVRKYVAKSGSPTCAQNIALKYFGNERSHIQHIC